MGGPALVLFVGAVVLFALFPQSLAELGLLKFDTLPVDDARVSQRFKPGGVHSGIDFACPIGSALFNVAPGKVIRVHDEPFGASGRFVVMAGRLQFSTLAWSYSHMEQVDVRLGQELGPGDLVGLSGNTGNSTGPHLHFEIRRGYRWQSPANSYSTWTRFDPQPFIDGTQYGSEAGHPKLPPAYYRVAETVEERGVFSFCGAVNTCQP